MYQTASSWKHYSGVLHHYISSKEMYTTGTCFALGSEMMENRENTPSFYLFVHWKRKNIDMGNVLWLKN